MREQPGALLGASSVPGDRQQRVEGNGQFPKDQDLVSLCARLGLLTLGKLHCGG